MRRIVLHIVGSLDFGGVEKHLFTLSKNTDHSLFNHAFIALGRGGYTEEQMRQVGADITVLQKKVKIPSLEVITSLYKLFSQENPEVVHTHGADANFHGLIAAKLAGVPVRIGEEIGIPSHSQIAKWVFKFVYSFSSAVIGVSSQVVDWLVENEEVPRNKTFCSYVPVEIDEASQKKVKEQDSNTFTLLTVCRLHPVKNISLAINTVRELIKENSNIELLVIGEGPDREKLETLVQNYGLQKHVYLKGYELNPWKYVQQADLFILPSYSEGLPVALTEAMLHNLPCIATKVGGANELIDHKKNGWLVDPKDEKSFIELIKEIKDMSVEERMAIGTKGAEVAHEKCNPQNYVERLDKLYLELSENKDCG